MKQLKNVERLISRCESVLSGKNTFPGQEWKLQRYIAALEDKLGELQRQPNIDVDQLRSFQQKLSVLREVLRNEEEPQGLFSTNSTSTSLHSNAQSPNQSVSGYSPMVLPHSRGNELLMKANNKKLATLRDQLFSKSQYSDANNSVRERQIRTKDEILKHHEQLQEEVAEDMIKMARSLKSSATLAKTIITNDNEALKKTTEIAEANIEKVTDSTAKLKEHNRGCNCGVWILLLLVFVTFIAMVLFIRVVPKPR